MDHNDFREIEPTCTAEVIAYRTEDLFQAVCAERDVLVDLGWYPDGDPAGRFVIQVHRGDFVGELLERREAHSRIAAVTALEDVLWKFHLP